MYNFDPYNVLLAIAAKIPVLLMTGFVVQGHIIYNRIEYIYAHISTYSRLLINTGFKFYLTFPQVNKLWSRVWTEMKNSDLTDVDDKFHLAQIGCLCVFCVPISTSGSLRGD